MKNRKRILSFVFTLLIVASATHAQGFLMWQAQRDGKVIHLLAGIDFLTQDSLTDIAPEIRNAFEKSEVILMESEMDMERRKLERRKIIEAASYPQGDNLMNHLPSAVADRFNKLCEKLVIQNRGMIRVKPWAAAYNLQTVAQAKLAIPLNNRMDYVFYDWANRDDKSVDFLNKPDEIIAMFGDLPEETHVRIFDKALNDIENMADTHQKAEAAWRASDADAAAALVDSSDAADPELRELLNRAAGNRWADKLEAQLTYEDNVFALVHLRNLVGRDRLLEKLKAKGFLIAQVMPE